MVSELSEGVVLPLSYFPSVDHYCYISQSKNILFEINETYPKQTCRNRTTILTANGQFRLTIPVIKQYGNRTKTSEILIDNKTPWNKIHWKAISSAYNKSPFFLYYKDDLACVILNPGDSLIDFNLNLINTVNKFLKITPSYAFTQEYHKCYEYMTDKRECNKNNCITDFEHRPYTQVFSDRFDFIPNLSILDLLFNEGPAASNYLQKATLKLCRRGY